jgi:hypothetical protein
MGLVGVGFASALAGQASKHTQKMISTGANPLRAGFWEPLDVDDMVFDALLGIFMFKVQFECQWTAGLLAATAAAIGSGSRCLQESCAAVP